MSLIKHITLPNGIQIIYENPITTLPISSVHVFCNIGSIHCPKNLYGATHFIEHMCFKGTKEHRDYNKLLVKYEDYAFNYNAFSTQRFTVFYIKTQDDFLHKSIQYLSEQMLHSVFENSNLKKEEKVVIEENVTNSDNPDYILNDITNELLYEYTPFALPVDNVSYHKHSFDYKQVKDFYKTNFVPSNMIISIITNKSFKTVLNMVKHSYFHINHKKEPSLHSEMLPLFISSPFINGVKYKIKEMSQLNDTYLNISFQTCKQFYEKDKYTLNLLSIILTNNLGGRLTQLLRQKYGLVYYVKTFTNYNESSGDFIINTKFHSENFIKKGVLPLIIKELNNLNNSGITQEELKLAKNYIKGTLLFDLQDINKQSMYNGTMCLLYLNPKKIIPYSKLYDTYFKHITIKDIYQCIKKYFCLRRMCVTVVGKNIPSIKTIARICNTLENT